MNEQMEKVKYILAVIVTAAFFSACHSSRGLTGHNQETVNEPASLADKYNSLVSGYGVWECVDVPVKVELKSPSRISLSGRAYMRRGTDIFISMRFLGMEVATLYVSKDSLFATEKLHKYYVAESISGLMAAHGITVSDIQDAMMGRAFVIGSGTLSNKLHKKVVLEPADGMWMIMPKKAGGIEYGFAVNDETGRVQRLSACVTGHKPVTCEYSDWSDTPAGIVANMLSMAANVKDKSLSANMVWSFGKAQWNNKDDLRKWKLPSGYTRLKSSDLIKMLSSF